MACCSCGNDRRKAKQDELKGLAASANPITSTLFVLQLRGAGKPSSIYGAVRHKWLPDSIVASLSGRSLIYEGSYLQSPLRRLVGEPSIMEEYISDLPLPLPATPGGNQPPTDAFPSSKPAGRGRLAPANFTSSPALQSTTSTDTIPLVISALASVRILQAVCGETHLLLRSALGDVYAFGVGKLGELGLGHHQLFVRRPEKILALSGTTIAQIAAGKHHSAALSLDGDVYTWGASVAIGDACGIDRHAPVLLQERCFSGRVRLICAGYAQTMAVTEKNQLFVWGETFFNLYHTVPHICDSVIMKGNIIQLAIGKHSAFALTHQGSVYTWGDGTYGELGRLKAREGGTAAEAIQHRALRPTETLLTDSSGAVLPKIIDLAAGDRHCLLLGENGNVFAFGDNLCGQCGAPTSMIRFAVPRAVRLQTGDIRLRAQTVAAGARHSGVITDKNQLFLWGHSSYHKLIHTASNTYLLEDCAGIGGEHMGVAVRSGWKECCPKVTCLCLGEDFTVVVTGDGIVPQTVCDVEAEFSDGLVSPSKSLNTPNKELSVDHGVQESASNPSVER